MTIANYGELKTEVSAFIDRASDASFVARLPSLVALAEASIRRDVRAIDMLSTTSSTMASGVIAQPARCIEVRTLSVGDCGVIDYMDPFNYYARQDWGYPSGYTINGSSILVAGGGNEEYTLNYWQSYAAFTSDANTNWLLTNAPDIYLYGTLIHAAAYMKDVDAATSYQAVFKEAVSAVNSQAKAQLTAGPMRERPRSTY